jgi:DNA-binding transcriptional LysR family regulator
MELLQLEYFRAVAESGHVTETARSLNVTQSSVSRTIQRLEEDLGTRLFDRVGRTLRLNDFGRVFLRRVEKALSELEQGKREIRDLSSLERGFVKLAVNTAGTLPGILGLFRKKHPNTQFHVSMVKTNEMVALLKKGDVDFGLSSSPVAEDDIHCQIVLLDRIVLAIPRGHLLAGHNPVDLSKLKEENFIGVKSGYGARDLTDSVCQSAGFLPRYIFEGDEPARVNSLVEAGIGVAFVPDTSRSTNESIEYLELDDRFVREIAFLRCEDHYISKAAEEFQNVVLEFFKTYSAQPNEFKLPGSSS